jgi:phosphate/sulfate permease
VVSTKVLTPRQAIAMAAFFDLTGALLGGAVASTIGKGLVDTNVVKLQPVNGFAAETTAALIIQGASYYGIPLSTTHVITTSIMGAGAVKRFSGMRWTVVERIIWAWLFTLPASGLIGYALERAF